MTKTIPHRAIGIYGGTYDPIHLGHLAAAETVRQLAHLHQILFIPNNTQPLKHHRETPIPAPAHDGGLGAPTTTNAHRHPPPAERVPGPRPSPSPASGYPSVAQRAPVPEGTGYPVPGTGPFASADARLRMLHAAIAGNPAFAISEIELHRPAPSYTIDTLDTLQDAHPHATLHFILGTDAANTLPDWHQPQRLLTDYHPIIITRAGHPGLDWNALTHLHPQARRLITLVRVPALAIASSDLRTLIASGRSIRYLVPDPVWQIIRDEQLYRAPMNPPPAPTTPG